LDWTVPAHVAWSHPDALVVQTCGWPLVTQLAERVHVIGTFDHDVPGAADGTYCSVLVTNQSGSLDELLHADGLVVAANSTDSLSGWISLVAVARDHGVGLPHVVWTGSHVASVDAVRAGRAALASIDAVTWAHLDRGDLRVVGSGPRVPCLPLVTSRSTLPGMLRELRDAFAIGVQDPDLADDRAELTIRAFVERDLSDYEPLVRLAPVG
jgi:ABC-type phosphate/phosphonate transport system substrate-binding protein